MLVKSVIGTGLADVIALKDVRMPRLKQLELDEVNLPSGHWERLLEFLHVVGFLDPCQICTELYEESLTMKEVC